METTPKHVLSHWYHGTPQEDIVLVRNTGKNGVSSCILHAPTIKHNCTGYVTRDTLARKPQLVAMESAPANTNATPAPDEPAPEPARADAVTEPEPTEPAPINPTTLSAKEAREVIAKASAEDLLVWASDPRPTVRKAIEERMAELGG